MIDLILLDIVVDDIVITNCEGVNNCGGGLVLLNEVQMFNCFYNGKEIEINND